MNLKNEEELRKHRCCFTGHRPEKLEISESKAKKLLYTAINNAISEGFITFISGVSRGVDMWAADIVLELRKNNPELHLVCASPYDGFEKRWSTDEQNEYNRILKEADKTVFVCKHYFRGCFQVRNEWMVDRSCKVIAMFNGEKSGTKNTIDYANRIGIPVENILR